MSVQTIELQIHTQIKIFSFLQ